MMEKANQEKTTSKPIDTPLRVFLSHWMILASFALKLVGLGFVVYGIWICIRKPESITFVDIGVFFGVSVIILALGGIFFIAGLFYRVLLEIGSRIEEKTEPSKIQVDLPDHQRHIDQIGEKMERMLELIKDMNENLLLSEEEKKRKLQSSILKEIRDTLKEIDKFAESREWNKAESLLEVLSTKYPDNKLIKDKRNEIEEMKSQAFVEELEQTKKLVADLVAISAYEKAIQHVQMLVEKYPDSEPARALLEAVKREQHKFQNEQIKRMYSDIEKSIERKRWNDALSVAYQLIERYPDAPEAEILRNKLDTLKTNAEIEKRQQLEEQFKDLVKRKNFVQALELAKYIINTYPNSPQANALKDQLSKLEELAKQERQG